MAAVAPVLVGHQPIGIAEKRPECLFDTIGSDQLCEAAMNFPEGHLDLYVTDIGEPSDNSLRIVVTEGLPGELEPLNIAGVDFGEGRAIQIKNESRHFELIWNNYVAYVVRNESYWKAEPLEPPMVDQLERRFNSAFLEFVSKTTFADDDYPGPLQHWALTALNHCIDVVSAEPPRVHKLAAKGS